MKHDLLKELRDIHYPLPIKVWPLAIGWYILIILLASLIAAGIIYWIRNYRKQRLKKIVLNLINDLQQKERQANTSEELSKLLRRSALASYPRNKVAGLYGEEWLRFLDETSRSKNFSEGPGQLLLTYPYQGQLQELPEELFHLIKDWVKKNL